MAHALAMSHDGELGYVDDAHHATFQFKIKIEQQDKRRRDAA